MIEVKCNGQGLIGDALCAVPYILHLCRKHGAAAIVSNGFNVPVQALLTAYPLVFHDPLNKVEATYGLDIHAAWQMNFRHDFRWHMGQMYFAFAGEPVPDLPMCYEMFTSDPGLPPGIIVSPFSRTNGADDNKFWPHDRWRQVLGILINSGICPRGYVVGTAEDDFSTYEGLLGVTCLRDRPLPEILHLLRNSPLVLGLDNGIGHLCHFGRISKNVLIYANCLPPRLAENPLGAHVRGAWPIYTSVNDVTEAAYKVMARHTVAA